MLSAADVAEASRRATKAMETDAYALEAEEQLLKATEDISRYELKSTVAKRRLKGRKLTLKLAEIETKLETIHGKQTEIKDYIKHRQEELLDAFIKEITKEKHSKKRRHLSPEDSEGDELDVSDSELFPNLTKFRDFSIPPPCPHQEVKHSLDRSNLDILAILDKQKLPISDLTQIRPRLDLG
jgi:hypothetical protein